MKLFVLFILQKQPVNFFVFVPFNKLSEFLAHKQKLFAGVAGHIGEKRTDSGKFFVVTAGQLFYKRLFAVNNFVVGKRKNIAFRKSIKKPEGKLVMII